MENHFSQLDWLVLAVYFALTIGVGLYCSRNSKSASGYTAADRSLPGWVCGLSIFATFLSSISFLALPGKSFSSNWTPFAFSLSLPLATWIAVKWFLPYYRASGEVSAYSLLENRFGPWARVYASGFYLLTQFARAGMVLYLMALPLAVILGVPIGILLVVIGLVVTAYAFIGGIVAVIWTDALQAIVLIGGALTCLAVILFSLPQGPGQLLDIAQANHKFSMGDMNFADLTTQTFWVVLINGIFINLQNFGIDQSYLQRFIASSSEKEARKSVWLGGLLYVPVSAVFFLIGTALFALYTAKPAELESVRTSAAARQVTQRTGSVAGPAFKSDVALQAGKITDSQIADQVFPYFIGKELPAGVTGLIISAVLAAGMSTVSTSLNSAATVLHSDFYKRFFRKSATDRQSLGFLRLATLAVGLSGTAISFLLLNVSSALDAWWTLSSVFSGGILGLFLLGRISRAGNPAAIIAVVAGVLAIAWMSLSQQSFWPAALPANALHPFLVVVVGTLVILFTGLLLTSLIPSRKSPATPISNEP